jgi:protein-S-isoprenylcysteine O-methyltransferase Ste14
MSIFEILWLAGLVIYLFGIYLPRMTQYKRLKKAEAHFRPVDVLLDFSAWLFWQVIPLIYIFSRWLDFTNYSLPAAAGWAGVILFAASLLLYALAYRELGQNWSPRIEVLERQQLVTSGIYHTIRHPVYAAMWLWALAQPLLLHNWIAGFGLLVVFLPLYILRMPREEEMMVEHFGQEYKDYMEESGRIIPHFWSRPRG